MLCLWPRLHREPGPFVWSGNYVPDFGSRMGRAFRNSSQAEIASRNQASERGTLSGGGLKRKPRPRSEPQSGTRFPVGASNGKYIPESAPGMGHTFRNSLNRKLRPRISLQSGMPFPAEPSGGKFIPELMLGVGHGFRMESQRKLRPSLSAYSGMRFPLKGSTGKPVLL